MQSSAAVGQPLAALRVSRDHMAAIVEHLRAAYPNEGCGLLFVPVDGDSVVSQRPISNIASHPRVTYLGEPLELLDAFLEMERRGWRLGAIYHSHPRSPAWPSAEDLRQAYYPSALTLIVSLARLEAPEARLFAIGDGQVHERRLLIDA